jgi:Fe-S oxidoreductase
VLRRVGGYNLDEFIRPGRRVNLSRLMVGSEGTLGVVLTAKLNLVPLPRAKAVMTIQFTDLLESLAATPLILAHRPSAVEVMDQFILDHTRQSPALHALRETFVEGDPGSLLCVEFYADQESDLPPKLRALERDLRRQHFGYHYYHALDPSMQARIWSLREAALGLSMTMKEDAKSLSFVEDTAVAPEKLRDYIKRFLAIIRSHGTSAGVYAHASVGCLHVRPVVNMKTEEGIRKFEAIANDVADLALEFGAALSKMFGPVLYEAFRRIKRTFDPHGIFNPGKIVDAPPLTANLRYGAGYKTARPTTFFDFTDYNGLGGAVEMCSGLGVCRKKLDGTMCPSYMVTREEAHSTRGRANVLRLAMAGSLNRVELRDRDVYEVLDLCLECRACKSECPVGVDVARFKSEFLSDYWRRHGTPFQARALGNIHTLAAWASRFAPLSNWVINNPLVRRLNERLLGVDRRRRLPAFRRRTLSRLAPQLDESCDVVLFNDTFTNHCDPAIGLASIDVLRAAGFRVGIVRHSCCGRPQISKGLLANARALTMRTVEELHPHVAAGRKIAFCEPSCLSAMREDVPSLQRGEEQRKAREVANACFLFEELVETAPLLKLKAGPPAILLHGHCHQKSMGLLAPARSLLSRIPGSTLVDLDAGCCGMAGSFGYAREHFEVSRQIGERRLLPAVRQKAPGTVVVASGTSCRHQVKDFTGENAVHPAILLQSLLRD